MNAPIADNENPYRFAAVELEPPEAEAAVSTYRQPESGRKLGANDVRILAYSQRGLWICALPLALWHCIWIPATLAPDAFRALAVGLPREVHDALVPLSLALGAMTVVAWVAGLMFVLAIASRTHSTWLGFAIWFVAMYPPILLLVTPYLQYRAAQALKRHGIPAGLFGASMRSLPKAETKRAFGT